MIFKSILLALATVVALVAGKHSHHHDIPSVQSIPSLQSLRSCWTRCDNVRYACNLLTQPHINLYTYSQCHQYMTDCSADCGFKCSANQERDDALQNE